MSAVDGANTVVESDRESRIEAAFVLRFVAFGFVMAFANVVPYLSTRGAHETDGLEVAGWPLRCYELGGVVGHFYFGPWMMAGDIAIAVIVSALAAWISSATEYCGRSGNGGTGVGPGGRRMLISGKVSRRSINAYLSILESARLAGFRLMREAAALTVGLVCEPLPIVATLRAEHAKYAVVGVWRARLVYRFSWKREKRERSL